MVETSIYAVPTMIDRRRNTTPASNVAREHTTASESVLDEVHQYKAGKFRSYRYEIEDDAELEFRLEQMNIFMSEAMTSWGSEPRVAHGRYEAPHEIDQRLLMEDNDPLQPNTYTLNPEKQPEISLTDDTNVVTLDEQYFKTKSLIGKSVGEVLEHVREHFADTCYFPDIACLQKMRVLGPIRDILDKTKTYVFLGSHLSTGAGERNYVAAAGFDKERKIEFTGINYNKMWLDEFTIVLYRRDKRNVV